MSPSAYLSLVFGVDEDLELGSRGDLVINVQSSWVLLTPGLWPRTCFGAIFLSERIEILKT